MVSTTELEPGPLALPHPADDAVVALAESASRHLCILSPTLAPALFDREALVSALSGLARRSRQTEIRILVSDTRALTGRGHRLLELSRRLPSAIHLHLLAEHPQWQGQTLVLRDRDGYFYLPDDSAQQGFYEPEDRARTSQHSELFQNLWRYSAPDPDLRALSV